MKILIIRPHASIIKRTNYNTQEEGLAKALVRKGHICDVVYYNGNHSSRFEKVTFDTDSSYGIFWLKARKIGNFAIYNKKTIDDLVSQYDIIQTNELEQIVSWYLLTHYYHKCVLYHGPYNAEFNKKYRIMAMLFRVLYKKDILSKITAIGKSYRASEYLRSKGINSIFTVGVGLDLSNLNINFDKNHNSINNHSLLYIGILEKRRNIFVLIDIVDMLKERYLDCKLTIIGSGKPDYVKKCRERIKEKNLQNYIDIIDKVDQSEIGDFYKASNVFLLASSYEIFGMVLMEAMLLGCVVITTKNGGSDTLIQDHINGFIVDNFDISCWINAISFAFDNDMKIITNNAKQTIVNKCTWDSIAEQFLKIYSTITSNNK